MSFCCNGSLNGAQWNILVGRPSILDWKAELIRFYGIWFANLCLTKDQGHRKEFLKELIQMLFTCLSSTQLKRSSSFTISGNSVSLKYLVFLCFFLKWTPQKFSVIFENKKTRKLENFLTLWLKFYELNKHNANNIFIKVMNYCLYYVKN